MRFGEYIGHFHPVLVHLPIGILLTAVLLYWLSFKKKYKKFRKSVRLLLLLGFVSAVFAANTGYLLSQSGEYEGSLLRTHQWMGISVAALSFFAVILSWRKSLESKLAYSVVMLAMAILVVLTGHAGGSLTHGSDYLQWPQSSENVQEEAFHLPDDAKNVFIYRDMVAPVLEKKCASCHGPTKQKGKLRLDKPEFIRQGGEDGAVVNFSSPLESDLLRRIHLNASDDDHMPPGERPQLSEKELSLLSFWIERGADFEKNFGSLPNADSMMVILSSAAGREQTDLPKVPMPDANQVQAIRNAGVSVSFLAADNGWISLNFINADSARLSTTLESVTKIAQQVYEIKLAGQRLSHADWTRLSALTALHRLNVANSNISDEDIYTLDALRELKVLNLTGTQASLPGLRELKSLSNLEQIYLFKTNVLEIEQGSLRQLFPHAVIDLGNYLVPTFRADTTEIDKPYVIPK